MLLGSINPFAIGGRVIILDAFTRSLMKFDGIAGATLAGNALVDYAKPSRSWISQGAGNFTFNGVGKFNGGAALSDGSGIVSPANESDYDIIGDFTIDFWCLSNGTTAPFSGYILARTASGAGGFAPWAFYQNSNLITFYASSNNTSWDIANNVSVASANAGAWTHVAVTRQGNVWRTWELGNQVSTWTTALVPMSTTNAVGIGRRLVLNDSPWGGYIDELRFSNIARYASAFTVPTNPYFGPLSGDNDAATRLLLHAEDLIDNASGTALKTPHIMTANGTAATSTGQAKFGSRSFRFDGSTNCLITTPFNTGLDLHPQSGDFTVDFWYYRVVAQTGQIIGTRSSQSQICSWLIYDTAAGNFNLYGSVNGGAFDAWSAVNVGAVPSGQWVHFALVHSNDLPDATAIRAYINGIETWRSGYSKGSVLAANPNAIGIGGNTDAAGCNAFIDEIRYSSVARWIDNFTPPIAPYS